MSNSSVVTTYDTGTVTMNSSSITTNLGAGTAFVSNSQTRLTNASHSVTITSGGVAIT